MGKSLLGKMDNIYNYLGRSLDLKKADRKLERIAYGRLWPIYKIFSKVKKQSGLENKSQ